MSEDMYQAVLFPGYEPPSHFFYVTTDMTSYKNGQARVVEKRMKDRQFNGSVLVGKVACNCELLRDRKGREYCVREIRWADAHRAARLPRGEKYLASTHVQTSLRWMFGDDLRALAIIDRVDRNVRGQTA
jgi:hypothetical protein